MPILRRNLTVHFQRSVKLTSTEVFPQSVEVSVIPLQDASNAQTVATYVGGVQTIVKPLVNEDNPVVFALVPSNFPGLTDPINYRIMWRVGGVTGRTETYDFSMPDADISFDELQSTGNIIDGQAYLQQSDLGVAGRVAKLDEEGKVIDAQGVPVAMPGDVDLVRTELEAAVEQLQADDTNNFRWLSDHTNTAFSDLNTLLSGEIAQTAASITYSLNREITERVDAVFEVSDSVTRLSNSINTSLDSLFSSVSAINTSVETKADLDGDGRVPLSQIPPEAITNWIPLSSAEDRFSLSFPEDVQLGDVVLTPTGVYGLTGDDPSSAYNWYLLNQVLSVNGKTGDINLSAEDVGAISSETMIPQSQITGLSTTISGLASNAIANSLQAQITNIVTDSTIVKLNSDNQIDSGYLDSAVAYVNVLNQIVKKDGTVISDPSDRGVMSVNGRTGVVFLTAADIGAVSTNGAISQSQITGLVSSLAGKADLSNGTVPLTQIPTLPQSKISGLTTALSGKADLTNGLVPMGQLPVMPFNKISGLAEIINSNGLSSLSNVVARITSLENRTGSTGGISQYFPAVMWNGSGTGDTIDLSSVVLSSPFGLYSTGPNAGKYYYNPSGVSSSDAVFPTVTPNGHLKLYKWNESNPADPVYALASDLTTVSNSVGTLGQSLNLKANQSDYLALNSRVNTLSSGKADLDLTTNTLVASQVPFIAKSNPKVVANIAAMRALTTSQVHVGDQAIITSGAEQGTYTLVGNDPSQIGISGWVLHPVPTSTGGGGSGTVVSVSGPSGTKISPDSTGNISLQASDLGAATSTSVSDLATVVSTRQTATQVSTAINSALNTSQIVRCSVDYAVRPFTVGATTYCQNGLTIASGKTAPSGALAIDKNVATNQVVYAPNNALVLLTNQSDRKYNGVWKVNSTGDWSRPDDYATGAKVYPDTLITVKCSFSGNVGASNYTVWQSDPTKATPTVLPNSPATIDTDATFWANRGSVAPITITGSGGIVVSGTYPDLVVGTGGTATFVRQFYTTIIPASDNASRRVTHNLNNPCPQVSVIEESSGNFILVGWKAESVNAILLDFSPTIMAVGSTYRVSIQG